MQFFRSLGTHNGTFHADEVTAAALLVYYDFVDEEKIIRTRDKSILGQCSFVCDVGGEFNPQKKRFDHHQSSYEGELSSAGMVWSYLKDIGVVDAATYLFLNHSLIQGVDAHDNGRVTLEPGVCSFSQIISNFVPVQYDAPEEEQNKAFHEALQFVLGHLRRVLARFSYIKQCENTVKSAMDQGREFLLFEKAMPWMDVFFELGGEKHSAQFIVMPSGDQWKLKGIPPTTNDRMKVRTPLPKEWAGLLEEELKLVSGISGAVFCHKGLFISVWKTKEDALKALAYTLKKGV